MAKQSIRLSDHFTYGKLLRFTLPSICMMVFTSIYGVVDGLFVSNFVGKTPFAAVNLVMPFVMILGGMGFMIGTGGTALVSKLLGEGKQDEAHRTFSMLVLFTLLLGAVLSAVGILTMPAVSRLLGASDAMMADCILYGRIVTGFTFAFMLQNVFQSFFIAAEKPRLGLFVTVAAGITNMVLDALFIAVFDWGVAGAAIATGLSQCVGGVLPLIYFLRPNTSLLRLRPAALRLRPILQSCGNGSSELMSNISSSLVGMLYNFQLMRLIGEDGVSAYGVLMYVDFIFKAFFFGYSIAVTPVVGYHYGAQNHAELKSLLRKSLVITALASLLMTGGAIVLAGPIADLFVGYDAALHDMTVNALRIYSVSFLVFGFNIFGSAFFTGLNDGTDSALISFLRTLVFQVAAILLLPRWLDINGIWLAVTAAESLTLLVTVSLLAAKRRKYHY